MRETQLLREKIFVSVIGFLSSHEVPECAPAAALRLAEIARREAAAAREDPPLEEVEAQQAARRLGAGVAGVVVVLDEVAQ